MPVYKLKNRKGWYFAFYFNKKKYKKETFNGKHMLSKTEALSAEYEFKKQLEDEEQRQLGNILLYDLFDDYMLNVKSSIRKSTYKNYTTFKNVYLILLPNKNIHELKPLDITKWKSKVIKIDACAKHKNRMCSILKNMFEYGFKAYNLQPKLQIPLMDLIKDSKPKSKDNRSEYLPPAEFEYMMTFLDTRQDSDYYYYVIFNLLYYGGLRIGELAALKLNDIKEDCIIIDEGYVRVNGEDIIQAPKTENSERIIMLDNTTKKLLDDFIIKFKPKDIVFRNNRKFMCQQRVREKLTQIAKASELDEKYIIKPHKLRHSHSSNLRKLGFDIITISERLGNTPELAAKTYIHATNDEQLEIAKKIRKNQ